MTTPEDRTELQRLAEWLKGPFFGNLCPAHGRSPCDDCARVAGTAILSLLSLAAEREELRAENERLKTWIEDHQRRDERFHELQDPRVEALESRYQDLVTAAQEAVIELRWADQRINGEHDTCGMCESVDALAALLPPQGTDE